MSKRVLYRHGDVFIEKLPDGAVEKKASKVKIEEVALKAGQTEPHLAEGEATGHFHGMFGDSLLKRVVEGGNATIVSVREAFVDHQEHKPINLPTGDYGYAIKRQYSILGDTPVID